jgi:hypothetical protein
MTYLKRFSPDVVNGRGNKASRPFEDFEYVKAIEPQKRGALHIHAVMRSSKSFVMTPDVIADLKMLAMDLGFGHQFDVKTLGGSDLDMVTASRYVAKYISKRNSSAESEIPFPRFKDVKKGRGKFTVRESYGLTLSKSRPGPVREYVYGFRQETIRKKVKQPRAWTASRLWGLTLGKLIAQQTIYRSDRKAGQAAMYKHMWTVWAHQLGIANPYKPLLAITA